VTESIHNVCTTAITGHADVDKKVEVTVRNTIALKKCHVLKSVEVEEKSKAEITRSICVYIRRVVIAHNTRAHHAQITTVIGDL